MDGGLIFGTKYCIFSYDSLLHSINFLLYRHFTSHITQQNNLTLLYNHIGMKITSTIFTLTILILISQINAASQVVNWPEITDVKSGDHKLLLQTLNTTTYTYTQYYRSGYTFAAIPYVVLGIRDLQIDPTNQTIDFKVQVLQANIKTTQFTTTVTKPGTFTIAYMYYMYITMSQTYKYTYYLYYSETVDTLLNNTTSANITKNLNNITVNESSSALVVAYFVSFGFLSNSNEYSISTAGSMVNSTSITIKISTNSSIYRIELMVIVVDVAAHTVGYINFLDYGYLINYNSGTSNTNNFSPPSFVYYNIMFGVTSMRIQKSSAINFAFNQVSNSFVTSTSFQYLKAQIIQWRIRVCTNTSLPYYTSKEQKCYDNCSNSAFYQYGENATYKFCALCNTNCLTCDGNSLCLTCNTGNKRELDNVTKSCICMAGYYDSGFAACDKCDYTCSTCSGSSTSCTSCLSGRTLFNNSCPCNDLTYDNLTNSSVCASCDYKCFTCQAVSTNCTKCSNTSNRQFDAFNLKCPCASRFIQDGNVTCAPSPLACTAPCVTCSVIQTNCTSCNLTNRLILSSSQCVCKSGFVSSSVTYCIQICGDGQILSTDTQCDDGNSINGDGCSSTCQIQSGFNCVNNSTGNPTSVCISNSIYTITTLDLVRYTSNNQAVLTVSFNPTPPSSIGCSLVNYVGQLQLSSYAFSSSSSIMTIYLNILQQITSQESLILSFALINQTTSVTLSVSNNLQLRPYSSFQLNLYQVEYVLVWLYIALLWLGAVAFIVFVNPSSFNGIFELFIFTAITWIGVQGQQKYSLLFVPLRDLRYIFGANLQLGSKSTLFQVFNIGCIMFALPLIGFAIILLLNKRKTYIISTKIKRFVLFDLLYGWLIVNGFLIAYGLGIISKITKLSGIDYGGIVFGTLYLLFCLAASYKLFFGAKELEINPKLQITKKNLYRPRVYSVITISYILISFIFISISKLVKINSIMMLGFFFIIFVLFALGNILINKIKYMLNIVILFFTYGCILLYNSVNSAVWCGLAITVLLYAQLTINFVFLAFERNNNKIGGESQIESQVPNVQNQNTVKKIVPNTDRQQYFEEEEASQQNKSALQGYFQNHFTVYEPTVKKPALQIGIAPPQMLYDTSGIIRNTQQTPKNNSNRFRDNRLARQKSMLNQQFLGDTQPKKQPRQIQQVDNDLIEIGNREVPMDAI